MVGRRVHQRGKRKGGKGERERERGREGRGERDPHSLKVSTSLLFTTHHVHHHWQCDGPQLPTLEQSYLKVRSNQSRDEVCLLLSQAVPHHYDMLTKLHTLVTKSVCGGRGGGREREREREGEGERERESVCVCVLGGGCYVMKAVLYTVSVIKTLFKI